MKLTRRALCQSIGAGALLATAPHFTRASLIMPGAKTLTFHNLHTGEKLTATYWEDGAYVPDALAAIDNILRDHRNNEVKSMDKKLMDLLSALQNRLDTRKTIEVVSGYRSPATNAMLRAHSKGVASHSLHMEGKAIDLRMAGVDLSYLRTAALGLGKGGVGYYPASDFVHVDTGRVRRW